MGRRQVHPLDCQPSTTGRMKSTHIAVNLGHRQQMHCRLQIPSKPREITLIHRRYSLTCIHGRATNTQVGVESSCDRKAQLWPAVELGWASFLWLLPLAHGSIESNSWWASHQDPPCHGKEWMRYIDSYDFMFVWLTNSHGLRLYNKRLGSAMPHHTQRQRGSRLRKSTVVSVTPFILFLRIWLSNGIQLTNLMNLHRKNDNATS